MNILILTGRFGMGHRSAAAAIKQELELAFPTSNINTLDLLEYLIPNLSGMIYNNFNVLVSKCSNLYNLLNKFAVRYNTVPFNSILADKIDRLFEEYSPDVIVSTLPICSKYISGYKSLRASSIPLFTCITDICTHSEWIAENTDLYFVGADKVKSSLIEKGILPEKIQLIGIPVKQNFKTKKPLLVSKEKKEVLIMGGGLGLIPSVDEMLERFDKISNIKTTVITGDNMKMYYLLKEKYPNINVIGYTDKVHQFMATADLVLSKAGGVTLFESIYSEVPLCILTPFLEQEKNNALYIEETKIGKVVWNKKNDIVSEVESLLQNETAIFEMKKNMRTIKSEISKTSISFYIRQLQSKQLESEV